MRKLTSIPGTETLGQNFGAFIDNMMGSDTAPIMRKHGLVNIDPNQWYPASMLLDALNELAQTSNTIADFTAIGLEIGQTVPMPPTMENPTLEQALTAWNDIYQFIHRGGDAGMIKCEKIGPKHWKTSHSVIYPDDMSYGILYGYGKRFLPPNTPFKVFYDPEVKARDYGGTGEFSIIHITWQ